VRQSIVWARLFSATGAVVLSVDWDEERGGLVAQVKRRARGRRKCGVCHRRCARYDAGEGLRLWRACDLGTTIAYLEAEAPRVQCPEHGVVVAEVPWARHDARFTRAFDDQASWLAVHASKSMLAVFMRVTWRTVGNIIERVVGERERDADRLDGLTRIGIDEVSFRKGHRYLTVVVNHDNRRVLWCADGSDEKTLEQFFALLGPERAKCIELVSADGAAWIHNVVKRRCPRALICLDPYHVVAWASVALDKVRRQVWNDARRDGLGTEADALKGARYALWKNPPDLTVRQKATLASIAQTNKPLYRAYLLKEQLRLLLKRPVKIALVLLDAWLKWARRSRLLPFIKLARSITNHRTVIEQTLRHGITNARVEALNNRIRLLTRIAFGFHSAPPLIAIVMLALGGLCPPLPGRA
jgi:transposase